MMRIHVPCSSWPSKRRLSSSRCRRPSLTTRSCVPLQAAERRAAEEADFAARLAHDARAEAQREEEARLEAKQALKTFLLK